MNQILSVNPQVKNGKNNKVGITLVIRIFAIFLMLLGIGITGTGAYSFYKNISDSSDDVLIAVSKPVITIERESADLINIVVTHDVGISNVTYTINYEQPVSIDGGGELEVDKEVELPDGTSNVFITAEDINGTTETYETSIIVEKRATITLAQEDGKIKAIIDSKEALDYIEYYWDDDGQNAIHEQVSDNGTKVEKLIEVLEGEHVLTIRAVDIEGEDTVKTQKVLGATKPELTITTDGERFFVNAKDDEGLDRIELTLNSNETITKQINGEEEYNDDSIETVAGENKLKVVVYNKNGLSTVKGVLFNK